MSWGDIALKNALKNPDVTISGDSKPAKRQDLSKLLPEGSKHETHFMQLWAALNGPELTREHKFMPDRKFRFDFAYIPQRVAIECEGFGHSRQNRYTSDVEKYNLAALEGWKVYRLTGKMINIDELQKVIDFIRAKEQA
jgi:very-short-patch-repair endonuclease